MYNLCSFLEIINKHWEQLFREKFKFNLPIKAPLKHKSYWYSRKIISESILLSISVVLLLKLDVIFFRSSITKKLVFHGALIKIILSIKVAFLKSREKKHLKRSQIETEFSKAPYRLEWFFGYYGIKSLTISIILWKIIVFNW